LVGGFHFWSFLIYDVLMSKNGVAPVGVPKKKWCGGETFRRIGSASAKFAFLIGGDRACRIDRFGAF
jgi:hypothetical protein